MSGYSGFVPRQRQQITNENKVNKRTKNWIDSYKYYDILLTFNNVVPQQIHQDVVKIIRSLEKLKKLLKYCGVVFCMKCQEPTEEAVENS